MSVEIINKWEKTGLLEQIPEDRKDYVSKYLESAATYVVELYKKHPSEEFNSILVKVLILIKDWNFEFDIKTLVDIIVLDEKKHLECVKQLNRLLPESIANKMIKHLEIEWGEKPLHLDAKFYQRK